MKGDLPGIGVFRRPEHVEGDRTGSDFYALAPWQAFFDKTGGNGYRMKQSHDVFIFDFGVHCFFVSGVESRRPEPIGRRCPISSRHGQFSIVTILKQAFSSVSFLYDTRKFF